METTKFDQQDDGINPYIALTDVLINLVLILSFFIIAVMGWQEVQIKKMSNAFARENHVQQQLAAYQCTFYPSDGKKDPLGWQRWVFTGPSIFVPGTAKLTPDGQRRVEGFGNTVWQNQRFWRRLEIEGHSIPPKPNQLDDWDLSARRAAAVAAVLNCRCNIPSWRLLVSGKGGQDSYTMCDSQERVEFIIHYVDEKRTIQ